MSSDDGGWSFRDSLDVKPASFGFGVAVHPTDPARAFFVPARKDQFRVPLDGKEVVAETPTAV